MHSIVGLELVACGKLVFLANQRIEALSSAMAPKAKAVAKPKAKAGGRPVVSVWAHRSPRRFLKGGGL